MDSPVQWGLSQMNRRMAIFNSIQSPGFAFEFTVHRQKMKTGIAALRCQRCMAANRKRQKQGVATGPTAYHHVSSMEDDAVWLTDPDSGHGCLNDGMVDCTEARTVARQSYKKAVRELAENPCSYEEAYSSILQNVEETPSASVYEILSKLPNERTARHTIARALGRVQKEADSQLLQEMDANGFSTPFLDRAGDQDDDESEATRIFSQRINREYEREFLPGSAISRKLNFDDTLLSERSTSSRLIETEEELSSYKRLLKRSREELAATKKREESGSEKIKELEKKLQEAKELNDKYRRFSEVRDNKNKGLPGVGLAKAESFFSKAMNPNLKITLPRIPSYLKMPKLKALVTKEFVNDFERADKTFQYQIVFDPRERCQKPLNPYPVDELMEVEDDEDDEFISKSSQDRDLKFAGVISTPRDAVRLALGNQSDSLSKSSIQDKFTLSKPIASWSIWSSDKTNDEQQEGPSSSAPYAFVSTSVIRKVEKTPEVSRKRSHVRNKLLIDELKAVAGKYRTWHHFSQAQIQCARDILKEANLWNRENRSKLYLSYMQIQPTELKEEEISDLARGSVQDYPAIEEYASLEHDETQDSEGYDSSNYTEKLAEMEKEEAISSETSSQATVVAPLFNESANLNISCNAQELMICEMREECEEWKKRCETANQRLLLANDKIRKALLLSEQKSDLERQLEQEKRENADLHLQLEKMKDAIKSQVLSDNLTSNRRSTANEVIENVIEVKMKNKELEKQIATLTRMERDFVHLQEKYVRLEAENRELRVKAHTGKVAEVMLEEKQKEIRDLRDEIRKLQPVETDAGDTTKILHFALNPLEEAHQEMKKQEAQKRARQDSSSDSDASGAKRRKDETSEEVEGLKRRLQKTEGNLKAAATEYQQVAQRYRRWCQNLTGFQIKMRDQSFCEVESIYDPGKSFSFKYNDENGAYELLETEYIERWSEQVETYLDCGHSIPAFLAAVTLELEQEAANLSRI
uniref:RING-type domain-containing protein n=1 Tax=Steinernema glaseri TaxID=37863 RepID=A0A1I8A367_9BILA